jgi:hypothetical protein
MIGELTSHLRAKPAHLCKISADSYVAPLPAAIPRRDEEPPALFTGAYA